MGHVTPYLAGSLQAGALGWQAIPGVEQFSVASRRAQITQPSPHSRHSGWLTPKAITASGGG